MTSADGQPIGYSYTESGDDNTSYEYTVTNTVSQGVWSSTGSGNETDYGGDDSPTPTAGLSDPGRRHGSFSANGGNATATATQRILPSRPTAIGMPTTATAGRTAWATTISRCRSRTCLTSMPRRWAER